MRIPVIHKEAYTVSLQLFIDVDDAEYTFIHCDIHTAWTKSVKQQLLKDFELLCSLNNQNYMTLSDVDDTKHHKFLRMFGFTKLRDVKLKDGSIKHTYIKSEK